jgi:hypothetical protein
MPFIFKGINFLKFSLLAGKMLLLAYIFEYMRKRYRLELDGV